MSDSDWTLRLRRAGALALEPRYVRARPPAPGPGETGEPIRHSAVLVLLGASQSAPELLLIHRAADLAHHAGQFGFPGGMREASDADAESTALRETREEVGISPEGVELCGRLPIFTTASSAWQIQPVLGWLRADLRAVSLEPDPREVEEAFWVPLSALQDPAVFREEPFERAGVRYVLPSYHLPGPRGVRRIWGATALMIHHFLERWAASGKLGP